MQILSYMNNITLQKTLILILDLSGMQKRSFQKVLLTIIKVE